MTGPLVRIDGERVYLDSPSLMPRATAFLWNRRMMLQLNCRGFAVAQHLQPEPARYAHAPNIQAQTFMQPEQPYYAHHPGRFVYVKDEQSAEIFSVPHEPSRRPAEFFRFSVGPCDIEWLVGQPGLQVRFAVCLPPEDAVELWTLEVRNTGKRMRRLGVYPFFTIGYMSWMNQAARYHADLGGIVAQSVTPYQKLADYEKVKSLSDLTYLCHDRPPASWEACLEAFEGEGGLQAPDGVRRRQLGGGEALYETPAAVLHYRLEVAAGSSEKLRFAFGPARDFDEIAGIRGRYLGDGGFHSVSAGRQDESEYDRICLRLDTPDPAFDAFVNHWLGRQVRYQAELNRLSTDPQTRNYLQDAMGMSYIRPAATKRALLYALGQQKPGGAMPDGILLHAGAGLRYINEVPHTDANVWLPVCLRAYLDESADFALLDETPPGNSSTVRVAIEAALGYLLEQRDARGLSLIGQGDWCDPMNMAGHKGRGVSAWLSMATAYALETWADICEECGAARNAAGYRRSAREMADAIQEHLWDGEWFARGITDDGRPFGVAGDPEGRIFLNPQAWALLADIATPEQRRRIVRSVERELEGPHGVAVLNPPYTRMREDIGRLTQKYPGTAENGSVYNHAAAFYIQALFAIGESDRAFRLLRRMIPGPDEADYARRGQLPVFLPNYYRGDWNGRPRTAGRSSQLVHTGTAGWFCRILVDGLFGVTGCRDGFLLQPRLPSFWNEARITRQFRGACFDIRLRREPGRSDRSVVLDGTAVDGALISTAPAGSRHVVEVLLEDSAP